MIARKKKPCIECGFPSIIFSKGRCKPCSLPSYGPINKVSKTRKKESVDYSKKRKLFLEENPVCQANLSGCTHKATQVHHKAGRIGKLFLDVLKWLASCDSCHKWIEAHPEEAKKLGLSLNRL